MKYLRAVFTLLVALVGPVVLADTFTVTVTDDAGLGSLRQAITEANNHVGADVINFNINGSGVHTISPITDFPTISDPVTIDGSTQPGFSGTPLVEISNASGLSSGLNFGAGDCEVRSLIINGFISRQILMINVTNGTIRGNFLGVNSTGTGVVAGSAAGIELINTSGIVVGGTTAADRNVISSITNVGIVISGGSATLQGNYVGLNAAGTATAGTPNYGVLVSNASAVIGGPTVGERNVIVAFNGIEFGGNPALGHSSGTARGNYIGTDATGTTALNLGNGMGVNVSHGNGVMILDNLISGNGDGVSVSSSGISGATSDAAVIQGNLIGTAADGATALGNTRRGIYLFSASHNHVGGVNASERNVIAFSGQAGVDIGGGATGNLVQGNSIFSNGGLGIDLESLGPTLNDPGDPDTGPNNLQNFPIINSVTNTGGNVTIHGSLNSGVSTTFRLEFFGSTGGNPSGFGEGQTILGSTNVTTNGNGDASYTVTFPVPGTVGAFSATATDPDGNTSEFSPTFLTRLLNISTRMAVLTEQKVLIGGFIITGSGPKRVIARGIGPSLSGVGISGALQDPILQLGSMSNDNWRSTQEAEILATGIPPSNDLESAIVASLDPGAYTAVLAGKDNTTGVGLVEIYDLDQSAGSKLANISTRGFVNTDEAVMIGGFIAAPVDTGPTKVLIRAIGPSLAGVGIQDPLQDPTLELHDGTGATIFTNDNWRDTQGVEIEATGIAPTDDHESAILQTLAPGNYTAIVRGANNTTGVGLVEAYNLR